MNLEENLFNILNSINKDGIDEKNAKELEKIIRCISPNTYGIENNILAYFDNINFVTEGKNGIKVSEGNLLTKKGIMRSRDYEFGFEFKNNTYSYDIIKNKDNKLERTNFKIVDSSSKFDKLDMFDFNNGTRFFNINNSFKNEKYYNEVYNILDEINNTGFNNELKIKFNELFKYVGLNTVDKLLNTLGNVDENYTGKRFVVTKQNDTYNLSPCIIDMTVNYDEDPNIETTFEKGEFLLLDNKSEALDNISNILSKSIYYEYSLKEI